MDHKLSKKKPRHSNWRFEVDCTHFLYQLFMIATFTPRKVTPSLFQAGLLTRDHSTFCTFPTKVSGFYADFVTLTAAGPWLNCTTFPIKSLKSK